MQPVHLATLDLNLALVLHVLLKERSVARASKRLGLSSSATSHALARLRDAVGDPLLVRTPRGLAPTARGEAMAENLGAAVSLLERAFVATTQFDPRTARLRFAIAATDYTELLLFPSLVRMLERTAPNVEVWLRSVTHDSFPSLRQGEVGLVIGVFSPDEIGPDLRRATVVEDRFVCVVRRGHPVLRQRLTLARFAAAKHVLVAPRGKGGGPVDDALAGRGHARSIAAAVPHFLAACHLVARTDLVLTVAERVARLFEGLLPVRVLDVPVELPRIRLSMVWHERYDADPAHRWLRARLFDAAAQEPPGPERRRHA
jgi:DNA-binding transcriptional LysR family regulator